MRDSKPQRRVQQLMMLKVTQNATNQDKHINEASKQTLPTISSKHHVNTRKVSFPIVGSFQCFQYTNLGRSFL